MNATSPLSLGGINLTGVLDLQRIGSPLWASVLIDYMYSLRRLTFFYPRCSGLWFDVQKVGHWFQSDAILFTSGQLLPFFSKDPYIRSHLVRSDVISGRVSRYSLKKFCPVSKADQIRSFVETFTPRRCYFTKCFPCYCSCIRTRFLNHRSWRCLSIFFVSFLRTYLWFLHFGFCLVFLPLPTTHTHISSHKFLLIKISFSAL